MMGNFDAPLSSEQRVSQLGHTIDPGFVHHRKIQAFLGESGMRYLDEQIRQLPQLPDWELNYRIKHIYTNILLQFCESLDVRPLQDVLASCLEDVSVLKQNYLFCSTEAFLPCTDIYDKKRCVNVWENLGAYSIRVELRYSTTHISSDTLQSELYNGGKFSIIGQVAKISGDLIILEPLIIGFPSLFRDEESVTFEPVFYCHKFYENFIEDIDEFAKVREVEKPSTPDPMEHISEAAFKMCLAGIFGDRAPNDWGGEYSDYFTAHLHLRGRRSTAAFLLKGPSRFRPMGLNHLGKNNDQIVRLSHEPANILIVQHSHEITSPVRETLRTFAVQPSNPRRYCLIDGRDSLHILKAYGLYDKALEMSKEQ